MKNMVPAQDLNGDFSYHYNFNYNNNPSSRRRRRYRENLGTMNDRLFEGYNDNIPLMVEEDELNKPMVQVQDKDQWLRLSIGGDADMDQPQPKTTSGLAEPSSTTKLQLSNFATAPFISPNPHLNWDFRPVLSHTHNLGLGIGIGNSSNSFIPYFSMPFQLNTTTGLVDLVNTAAAGPSSDTITLVDPPPRPHSGIWFTLQPFQNQGTSLPQRSSSSTYLRIKDGRMTVRLLIKYLVNKLRLDSESQVEIRCRGEKLEPCLTMQHIRDNIWRSKEKETLNNITLLPHSSTIDHVMLLHYLAIATAPPSN